MKKLKEFVIKTGIYRLIIIILSLFLIVGLFTPYQRSIGEKRVYLESNPNDYYVEEVNLKNKDVINISILENFKVYNYAKNNSEDDKWVRDEAIINFVITIVLMLSIVVILTATIFKKYILGIIFDVIMGISSLLMNFDIVSRGVIPSKSYTFGISFYLYIVLSIVILILFIMAIINKKKGKKEKKKKKGKKQMKKTKEVKKENDDNKVKVIAETKVEPKTKIKKNNKGNKFNKDKKEKTIKFNKITMLYIIGGIIIVLLVVIILLLLNGKSISKKDDNKKQSDFMISNKENRKSGIKGNTIRELKTNIKEDYNKTVKELKNEFNELKTKTDTVEKYKKNKDQIKAFYKKIEDKTSEFCKRTKEYTVRYGEIILNSGKDFDAMYDDLDYIHDDIYDEVLSDLEDEMYYGLLDEMSDFYYYGILDDSYYFKSYDEYYDISNDEYKNNSKTASTVYKLIDQTEDKVYKLYSRLVDAIYEDKLDKAKEKLNDFKEDLKQD